MRKHGILLAAFLLTLVLLSGAALANHGGTVKIGALLPLTGDLAAYGTSSLNGLRLAIDEINAAGGILGHQVELAVGDTQTVNQAGVDAATKLVTVDGVIGIVGAMSSGVSIPVATSVSSVYRVVQISPASTSPVITTLADNDFLFRDVASDALQSKVLANLAYERGYRKVSILYVNNDYGQGLADAFEAAFTRLGGKVVGSRAYEPGNASYRADLQAVQGGEVLLLIGYPENGVTILRQALEEGFFAPGKFLFTDGMQAPEIIDALGAAALNGSIGTTFGSPPGSEAGDRFTKAYESRFGERPPKPYIDTAYDAAILIALAAEAAGTTDRIAIRDNLRKVANPPGEVVSVGEFARAKALLARGADIDYVGASGDHNFDDNGDTTTGWFQIWGIENGQIKVFKLVNAAE